MIELTKEEAEAVVGLHAAHVVIYAKSNGTVLSGSSTKNIEQARALVMATIRFDGKIGFPGGFIDPGETWLEGVNRELREELDVDTSNDHLITDDHYVFSFLDKASGFCLHLYACEVTEEKFVDIERGAHEAEHYGFETLGVCRIPLHTSDKGTGLPSFLQHYFVGYAKEELLRALKHTGILSEEEIELAVKIARECESTRHI
uniref:U8 snoRNA-decapping enzyme n=1 Tax=Plectus sambesii TaxID=2011161 RepID=A0A914WZM3_9BILA